MQRQQSQESSLASHHQITVKHNLKGGSTTTNRVMGNVSTSVSAASQSSCPLTAFISLYEFLIQQNYCKNFIIPESHTGCRMPIDNFMELFLCTSLPLSLSLSSSISLPLSFCFSSVTQKEKKPTHQVHPPPVSQK